MSSVALWVGGGRARRRRLRWRASCSTRVVSASTGGRFPLGTLIVNLSGALVLGIIVGLALHGNAYLLAGTAVIGSYTTFSTWMFESHRLAEDGADAAAGAQRRR